MSTSNSPLPVRVLYLACNPPGTTQLDLEREIAAVEARIRAGAYRDTIRLIPALAGNTDDLQRAILEHRPNLIHFSGHGQGDGGLVLRGPDHAPKPVSAQAMTKLFALYRNQLHEQFQTELYGVVLNACDSAPLAQKVGRVVGGAIGMRGEISDPSAISFAATLYQGLSFGCTLRQAFDQAVVQLMIDGSGEEGIPAYFPAKPVGGAPPKPPPADPSAPVQTGPRVFPWANEPNGAADILIVIALPEERDALFRHLPGAVLLPPRADYVRVFYAAEVPATVGDQHGAYRVVVAPLLKMGGKEAVAATQEAIRLWKPGYVLLVGIAGGYAANGVGLGDVLVPTQIGDYSLGKKKGNREAIRWEGQPTDTRLGSWAQALPAEQWVGTVKEKRPADGRPRVHQHGTVATGDKVIASRRVLDSFNEPWGKLLGVEMEAGGVAKACFDAPDPRPHFFMVRGVSDLADEEKGAAPTESWRPYACDVAAAYATALIQSGPVPFRPAV